MRHYNYENFVPEGFVNPRPSAAKLVRLYESYYDATEVVPEKWEREMRDVFEECGDWLDEGSNVGIVLDVGCSFGHLLRTLERRGWQTTGIEPSPVAAEYAERLIRGERVAGHAIIRWNTPAPPSWEVSGALSNALPAVA